MPTEEGNKRREAAMAKYGQVLGEIFDDLDKDKSGFASIEEMWYVVVEKLLDCHANCHVTNITCLS